MWEQEETGGRTKQPWPDRWPTVKEFRSQVPEWALWRVSIINQWCLNVANGEKTDDGRHPASHCTWTSLRLSPSLPLSLSLPPSPLDSLTSAHLHSHPPASVLNVCLICSAFDYELKRGIANAMPSVGPPDCHIWLRKCHCACFSTWISFFSCTNVHTCTGNTMAARLSEENRHQQQTYANQMHSSSRLPSLWVFFL